MEPIPSATTTVSVNPQMEFLRLFKSIHNVLLEQMNGHIRELDLTISQVNVLVSIASHRGEGVSQREIERELYLSNPTVTGILQRLEAKGFVTRVADEQDRRYKRVRLTARCERLGERIQEKGRKTFEQIFQGFTPEEFSALNQMLERLLRNCEAAAGNRETTQSEETA